jgi:hypothetical protein
MPPTVHIHLVLLLILLIILCLTVIVQRNTRLPQGVVATLLLSERLQQTLETRSHFVHVRKLHHLVKVCPTFHNIAQLALRTGELQPD